MNTKKTYCYKYPRPAYTADCMVFTNKTENAEIVLIKRKHEPFKNHWALPGGFVDIDETSYEAAKRELFEETGITVENITEFGIFDALGRDPRGRTVSVVYYIFKKDVSNKMTAGDDASEVQFFPIKNLPELAFDHKEIIMRAIKKLID